MYIWYISLNSHWNLESLPLVRRVSGSGSGPPLVVGTRIRIRIPIRIRVFCFQLLGFGFGIGMESGSPEFRCVTGVCLPPPLMGGVGGLVGRWFSGSSVGQRASAGGEGAVHC